MYGWLVRGGQKRNQAVLVWLIGLWNELREIKAFCLWPAPTHTSLSSYCVFLPTWERVMHYKKEWKRKWNKWWGDYRMQTEKKGKIQEMNHQSIFTIRVKRGEAFLLFRFVPRETDTLLCVCDLTFNHHSVKSIMWTCLWVKSIAERSGTSLCITEVIHISNPYQMNVFSC